MSNLNPTRVHFAGLFRADVSTFNNDDRHFDSATFTPKDQGYGPNELFLICSYCPASIDLAVRVPSQPSRVSRIAVIVLMTRIEDSDFSSKDDKTPCKRQPPTLTASTRNSDAPSNMAQGPVRLRRCW